MPNPFILCLDDDADLLYLHTIVLERAGFQVAAATDGESALKILQANPIDLVVTDHVMPGASGEELITKMRQIRPGMPVLLLTGMPRSAVSVSTADAVLEKTSGTGELVRQVRALLEQRG